MELDVFKKFLHKYLKGKGFEKIKNRYFLKGKNFLCMIYIYRSAYAPIYYFDYSFFLGEFEKPYILNETGDNETYTPYVGSRFYFTEKDKCCCNYFDYSEEELKALMDKNFKERINPPFEEGKKYLLEHFDELYSYTHIPKRRIMPLLESGE